jgi:hypothetical protein
MIAPTFPRQSHIVVIILHLGSTDEQYLEIGRVPQKNKNRPWVYIQRSINQHTREIPEYDICRKIHGTGDHHVQ